MTPEIFLDGQKHKIPLIFRNKALFSMDTLYIRRLCIFEENLCPILVWLVVYPNVRLGKKKITKAHYFT